MKKPFKFDEVDHSITCSCGKPLKENVLTRVKEKVIKCYKCWTIKQYNRGHIMNDKALHTAGIVHIRP